MQSSALCRSRRELSSAYLLAKFGFDTAENEPSKVWPIAGYSQDAGPTRPTLGRVGRRPTCPSTWNPSAIDQKHGRRWRQFISTAAPRVIYRRRWACRGRALDSELERGEGSGGRRGCRSSRRAAAPSPPAPSAPAAAAAAPSAALLRRRCRCRWRGRRRRRAGGPRHGRSPRLLQPLRQRLCLFELFF